MNPSDETPYVEGAARKPFHDGPVQEHLAWGRPAQADRVSKTCYKILGCLDPLSSPDLLGPGPILNPGLNPRRPSWLQLAFVPVAQILGLSTLLPVAFIVNLNQAGRTP